MIDSRWLGQFSQESTVAAENINLRESFHYKPLTDTELLFFTKEYLFPFAGAVHSLPADLIP